MSESKVRCQFGLARFEVTHESFDETPMVSVGIPTFNGEHTIGQAIDSILRQDYKNIEIIVSDNASIDATGSICEEFSAKDRRVKYFRQPFNIGPTLNFIEVLRQSTGDYFMWLGDDDWIDECYISQCIATISKRRDISLVCGRPKYYINNEFRYLGKEMNLLQTQGKTRVWYYYAKVEDNGTFYGIMRRADINELPLRNVMGADWHVIAALAFIGKIKTLDSITVHRSLGGATVSYQRIATALSLPKFQAKFPILTIALAASRDILGEMPAFSSMRKYKRCILASEVLLLILIRKSVLPVIKDFVRLFTRIWPRARKTHYS